MKITKFAICFLFLTVLFLTLGCNEGYDDSELTGRVENLENKVQKLEEQMNSNISSLQSIMEALQENDYITSVTPIIEGGKETGYTISFKKGNPITIYYGQDGQDGYTPQIGVKQDTDGIYYWTLEGEWMTDESGNKIKAQGIDGQNGQDGEDGQDGQDGAPGEDGITPQFKIEDDYWWVSYDNGTTWEKLGQATGDSATSIFKDVTKNDKEVIFTLNDNTTIVIPLIQKIEINFDYEGDEVGISEGKTLYINYTLMNASDDVKVTASSDGNFVTKVESKGKTGGRISVKCINGGTDGYINVIVNDGNGYSDIRVINIYKNKIYFSEGLEYKTSAQNGKIEIPVSVNFDYDVAIIEGSSWVSLKAESRAAIRDEILVFNIEQNTSESERYAIIQLHKPQNTDDVYAEIMISQSAREFSIEKNRFTFYQNGGVIEANITSSLDIIAEVKSSDTSWLSTEIKKEDNKSYKLIVNAKAITSSESRNSEISIYSLQDNILLGKIYVVQSGISEEDANAMILVSRANYSNDFTAHLPLMGELDCYVDWGDGNVDYYNGYYNYIKHKYSTTEPTSYDVKITGKVDQLNSKGLIIHTITEVKQWGKLDLTSVTNAFSGNSILKIIPNDIYGAFENVKDFNSTFYGCTALSIIPEGLFNNCTNVRSFDATFSDCTSLSTIPEGLFNNCTNVTSFYSTFSDCTSLSTIPEGLFNNCTNVTSFYSTFSDCTSLSTIPEGLFNNCTNVTSFGGTFSNCTSLRTIPEKLFVHCTNVIDFASTFQSCTSLSTIPDGLFDSCINVTDFRNTFSNCYSLTTIPSGLFDNNRKVQKFNATFGKCNNLTCESPYTIIDNKKYHLYERNKNIDHFITPDGTGCFTGSTNLIDYDKIPDDWK